MPAPSSMAAGSSTEVPPPPPPSARAGTTPSATRGASERIHQRSTIGGRIVGTAPRAKKNQKTEPVPVEGPTVYIHTYIPSAIQGSAGIFILMYRADAVCPRQKPSIHPTHFDDYRRVVGRPGSPTTAPSVSRSANQSEAGWKLRPLCRAWWPRGRSWAGRPALIYRQVRLRVG